MLRCFMSTCSDTGAEKNTRNCSGKSFGSSCLFMSDTLECVCVCVCQWHQTEPVVTSHMIRPCCSLSLGGESDGISHVLFWGFFMDLTIFIFFICQEGAKKKKPIAVESGDTSPALTLVTGERREIQPIANRDRVARRLASARLCVTKCCHRHPAHPC